MDAIQSIKASLELSEMVALSYLNDLSDEEFLMRPQEACNHINWQVGHLVASENQMMSRIAGESFPALPEGFAEKYTRETTTSSDAADFATKDQILAAYKEQRAGTLEFLQKCSPEDLDKETGVDYAPTVGSMLSMQGVHWLMHCGQWVPVRRATGKPIAI